VVVTFVHNEKSGSTREHGKASPFVLFAFAVVVPAMAKTNVKAANDNFTFFINSFLIKPNNRLLAYSF
jgi:hypothetical protein